MLLVLTKPLININFARVHRFFDTCYQSIASNVDKSYLFIPFLQYNILCVTVFQGKPQKTSIKNKTENKSNSEDVLGILFINNRVS